MNRKALIAGIWALAVVTAGAKVAPAQTTYTWTGGGGNGNWTTAANWSGSVVPVSDQNNTQIALAGTTNLTTTLDLLFSSGGGLFDVNSLTFNSGAGAFVVNPTATNVTTLQVWGGRIPHASNSPQAFAAPISVAASQTWATNGTGALTVTGAVNLGSNNTLTLGGSNSGAINLNGAVTVGANDTLTTTGGGSG